MSNPGAYPATIYFCMTREEWRELHEALVLLPSGSETATLIAGALDRIEQRTEERFGMVVWSWDDLCGVVGARRGRAGFAYGDSGTLEQAGITREQAADIAMTADGAIEDVMTEAGWDALEYVVATWLEEHGMRGPDEADDAGG
ncbi:MAG: hypothetical protein ACKVT1_12785 [Dehalococcoidia bacterium]